MSTVRDARIAAAIRAMQDNGPRLLEGDELYYMAVAVVDALFLPDQLIDNATV